MTTTLSRSQTFAFLPKCCWNTPMVPGPQTSWVMSTSPPIQTLSPGGTEAVPAWRASVFSVRVIEAMERTPPVSAELPSPYYRLFRHRTASPSAAASRLLEHLSCVHALAYHDGEPQAYAELQDRRAWS